MKLLDQYKKYFNSQSKENEMYGLLSAHVIIGQMAKDIKLHADNLVEDLRLHLLLLQRSGSGKSAGANVYLDLLERLGYRVHKLDDFSDAAAVGGFIPNEDGGHDSYEGFLAENDFVHADEASMLFDPGRHQMKMANFIQKACNALGTPNNAINRSLSGGEIEINPHASFILTTFPPESPRQIENILNNGLLQRMLFYPRVLDEETSRKMTQGLVEMFYTQGSDRNPQGNNNEQIVTMENLESLFTEFRASIQNITEVTISQDTQVMIKQTARSLRDLIRQYTERDDIIRKMGDFINRWIVMIFKIAAHHALLNGRSVIQRDDLMYSNRIIQELAKSTYGYIEYVMTMTDKRYEKKGFTNHEKIYEAFIQLLRENSYEGVPDGYVSKRDLATKSRRITGKSASWFEQAVKTLDSENNIQKEKVGRTVYFRIIPPSDLRPNVSEETKSSSSSTKQIRRKKNA